MAGVSNSSSLTSLSAEDRAGGGRLGGRRQRLHSSLARLMSPLHVVLDTLRTVSRLDQGRQLGEGGFSDRRLNTATTARRQRRRKHSKPKPKALSNNKITYPSFPHFKPQKLQDILVGKKSGTILSVL